MGYPNVAVTGGWLVGAVHGSGWTDEVHSPTARRCEGFFYLAMVSWMRGTSSVFDQQATASWMQGTSSFCFEQVTPSKKELSANYRPVCQILTVLANDVVLGQATALKIAPRCV